MQIISDERVNFIGTEVSCMILIITLTKLEHNTSVITYAAAMV